jgi:shikimate dehydrogenase
MSRLTESSQSDVPWVNGNSRVFGVIAHPVTHVRAPMVFNPRFAAAGLGHIMVPIDAPPEMLETIVKGLQNIPNFGGLAVTIPHKLAMAELCDHLGTAARLTGAVNAVRFDPDGHLYGDNFDGAGFVAGCRGNGFEVSGKNILMLGAGGAARAIAAALCEAGVGHLKIANRNVDKAHDLVDLLVKELGFTAVSAQPLAQTDGADVDMIINSTSLGLHADDTLPLALDHVSKHTVIADIIMVPADTKWLQDAVSRGWPVHPGRHMLDYQIDLIGRFIAAF